MFKAENLESLHHAAVHTLHRYDKALFTQRNESNYDFKSENTYDLCLTL